MSCEIKYVNQVCKRRGDGVGEGHGGGVTLVGMVVRCVVEMVTGGDVWLLIVVVRGDGVSDGDGVVVRMDQGGGDDRRRPEGEVMGSRESSGGVVRSGEMEVTGTNRVSPYAFNSFEMWHDWSLSHISVISHIVLVHDNFLSVAEKTPVVSF
nr:hypothetical protein [Tanacetum cinerariifolium]